MFSTAAKFGEASVISLGDKFSRTTTQPIHPTVCRIAANEHTRREATAHLCGMLTHMGTPDEVRDGSAPPLCKAATSGRADVRRGLMFDLPIRTRTLRVRRDQWSRLYTRRRLLDLKWSAERCGIKDCRPIPNPRFASRLTIAAAKRRR